MMRVARLPLAWTLSLLLAATAATPPPTYAQGDKDAAFKEAMEARERRQWPQMVTQLQRAAQEDGKESTRKVGARLGIGGKEYLPHFFLGEAHFNQGNCASAMNSWETSEGQGVVKTRGEFYSVLTRGMRVCEEKGFLPLAKLDAAVDKANRQLGEFKPLATGVTGLGNAHAAVWRSGGFEDRYQRVSAEYNAARESIDAARRSRLQKDFDEVAQAAERVMAGLRGLEADLNAAIARGSATLTAAAEVRRTIEEAESLDKRIDERKAFLDPPLIATRQDGQQKLTTARGQLASRSLNEAGVTSARAAAGEAVNYFKQVLEAVEGRYARDLKARFDRAQALASEIFGKLDAELATITSLLQRYPARASADITQRLDAARKEIESAHRRRAAALRTKEPAAVAAATAQANALLSGLLEIESGFGPITLEDRGVPKWLQDGASRFFAGDFAGALGALDDGTAEGAAALHVHLFRAAALHGLYVRSGERDTARRTQAIDEVKRCKALDPVFLPDASAFSPRFLAFYQTDGAPAAQAAAAGR